MGPALRLRVLKRAPQLGFGAGQYIERLLEARGAGGDRFLQPVVLVAQPALQLAHLCGAGDARNQHGVLEGLGDEVARATLQRGDLHRVVGGARQHDDRAADSIGLVAQGFEHREPVDLGHVDVEQHDMGLDLAQ